MKKRKVQPPVVAPGDSKKVHRRLQLLVITFLLTSVMVIWAEINRANADEALEVDFRTKVMSFTDSLFGQPLITPEEASAFEDLFNNEMRVVHNDMITEAEYHAQQIDCLVKAIYFEAAKEPELGKMWVYHVINNRVKQQYRGMTTYCDVIYDHKQFSFANLTRDRVPDNNRFLKESVDVVLKLYGDPDLKDITCGATHYLNVEKATDLSWYRQALAGTSPEGLTILAKVGQHTFLGPEGSCN